jgi:hypothetical protein
LFVDIVLRDHFTHETSPFRQHVLLLKVGDNDWNDCKNPAIGLQNFRAVFNRFDEKYWEHNFLVERGTPDDTFSFIHKDTLFIGLNLVNGKVHNEQQWTTRLTKQVQYTKDRIGYYANNYTSKTMGANTDRNKRVVIFGHASPTTGKNCTKQHRFFNPLRDYMSRHLSPSSKSSSNFLDKESGKTRLSIPILYIHGDLHTWKEEKNFLNHSNAVRISLTGEAKEPPLKVKVSKDKADQLVNSFMLSESSMPELEDVFTFERRL